MLNKRILSISMGAALFAAGLVIQITPTQAEDAVRIGTSSVGSTFYTIAVGASEIIQKHSKLGASVQPVGGSTANVRGLGAKKIEFALANAFASLSGYNGTHKFKGKQVDVRLTLQGQPSYRMLFVRKGLGIKTPKDLEGKIVIGKRRALPELELTLKAYAKVFGLDLSKVNIVATTNTGEALKAIRSRSVHAAILPFSRRAPLIEKALRDGVMEFLVIREDKRDAMLKLLPKAMHAGYFEPGLFSNQDKAVHLFELNTYFLTHSGISEDTVYQATKAILDNNKEFVSFHKAARQWTAERSMKDFAVPFHPGAIRYYKERGLWTNDVAAKQTALLHKK